jgi:hypothetical protein
LLACRIAATAKSRLSGDRQQKALAVQQAAEVDRAPMLMGIACHSRQTHEIVGARFDPYTADGVA